ncbi:hypothetical protein ACQP2T_20520 [Nonomuraea sp. CA-143628]|uniref:hypothetical protein n=1 Tax=Nonomuraea sp. CA-143628 TaxID=3239997 RepID=UPI003D92A8EE
MAEARKFRINSFDELRFLDLKAFPIAADFTIELADEGMGSSIRFLAPELSVVVSFPWWENVKEEISEWSLADIPNGSIESPYWDMDQGWHILIWQSNGLVYVAQGGEVEGEYDDWFSLPAALYRSEWNKVIRLASSTGQ